MVIPYRTTRFKSANTFAMAIWDPTIKFNSRQYFRLYGTQQYLRSTTLHVGQKQGNEKSEDEGRDEQDDADHDGSNSNLIRRQGITRESSAKSKPQHTAHFHHHYLD